MEFKAEIDQIVSTIDGGTIQDLKGGLESLNKISPQVMDNNANSAGFEIGELMEAIRRNIITNSEPLENSVTSQSLRGVLRKTVEHVPPKLKKEFMSILPLMDRTIETTRVERELREEIQKEAVNMESQIVNQLITGEQSSNMKVISPQLATTPIERSVEMYGRMFQAPAPIVTQPDELPSTMRLLTSYAQIKNTLPVGSLTNQRGSAYVGIRVIDDGANKRLLPFEKVAVGNTKTPSIGSQLEYHAGRTINSWNEYVKEEADFVNFFRKISTPAARLQYVEKQFTVMNIETFSAEACATLVHYYIYVPLIRFNNSLPTLNVEPNLESFLNNYSLGGSIQENPLMLSLGQAKTIMSTIFAADKIPTELYGDLSTIIAATKTKLNDKEILTFIDYGAKRLAEASAYMRQNGIEDNLVKKVLASNDWSSVKKRKFVIENSIQNSQVTEIAKKVVTNSEAKSDKPLHFSTKWGDEYLHSADYIWRDKS